MAIKTKFFAFFPVMLVASAAFAQKAGDTIMNIGLASVKPSASLGVMNSDFAPFTAALSGAKASIDRTNTLALSFLHMYSDNMGVDVSVGVPPKLTVDLNVPGVGTMPAAATAKGLMPALVGKYFYNTREDKFRPFAGLGITYASFSSVKVDTSNPLVNTLAGTSASLSSSWAPVYTAGMVYNIDEKLSITGSVTYIPLQTTIKFVGSGATTSGALKLNPTVYMLSAGYKF